MLGVLGRHEQGSLAPVEAEEKRGGGCGIGWIEGRREMAVVGQAQKHRGWVAMDLGDGMENSGGGWGGSLGNRVRSKMD